MTGKCRRTRDESPAGEDGATRYGLTAPADWMRTLIVESTALPCCGKSWPVKLPALAEVKSTAVVPFGPIGVGFTRLGSNWKR